LTYINDVFGQDATIEESFDLHVRDNLPVVYEGKYNARRRATCDFCKEKHDTMTEHCELEVMGLDTSKAEVASKVLLQNVLDQMYYIRTLALAVLIKSKAQPKLKQLRHMEYDETSDDEVTQSGVTLSSCFSGY